MPTDSTTAIDAVDQQLWVANRDSISVPPVRVDLKSDLDAAYLVQGALVARRVNALSTRIGRKVGLTSPAVQKQLGVDQPDFGVLLGDMFLDEDQTIPLNEMVPPRIEAEIAFHINRDITDPTRATVEDAIDWIAPALEIVDSRIDDWNISIVDTVADNASSAYFVLGDARASLAELTPRDVSMTLTKNGKVVSSATGADCLGDPIDAVVWVAVAAARIGRPFLAGEIITSGALGPMTPISAGDRFRAEITGLGTVSSTVSGEMA